MKSSTLVRSSFAALVLCGALSQQAFAERNKTKTYYGDWAMLGGAKVRTYVTVVKDKRAIGNHKVPVELGVQIPKASFAGLPHEHTTDILYFPNQARNMAFQYMMLNWNPHGHVPPGVYDLPHFDFHFYIQDWDEVKEIGPEDYATSRLPVPVQFMPQGYVDVGAFEPQMGNHLLDPTSPEFQPGGKFTRTFIYGAYDGHITFYEPMITVESLNNNPNHCIALKLPQAWEESGYYPTKYCTAYDSETKAYRISLNDFVYRTAYGQ